MDTIADEGFKIKTHMLSVFPIEQRETCYDIVPRFTRSHLKDRLILSTLRTLQGHWKPISHTHREREREREICETLR